MKISKSSREITLTEEETIAAIQYYLLANDIRGTVTRIITRKKDVSDPGDEPLYAFDGLCVDVESD